MRKYYMFMVVWCAGFFVFDIVVGVIHALSNNSMTAWDFAFGIIMAAFFVVNYLGYRDAVALTKEEK